MSTDYELLSARCAEQVKLEKSIESLSLNSNGIPVVREKIVNRIAKEDKPAVTNRPITSSHKPKVRKKKVKKKEAPLLRANTLELDNPTKHIMYGLHNMAMSINSFTYEGRPKRSPKKLHTVAEHEEFLAKLLEKCWEIHNTGVKELGDR